MSFELSATKGKTEKLEELIAKSLANGGEVCLVGMDDNMVERILVKTISLGRNSMVATQGVADFSHEVTVGRTRNGMKEKHIIFGESFCFPDMQKSKSILTDICPDGKSFFEKKKASKPYQVLSKKRF